MVWLGCVEGLASSAGRASHPRVVSWLVYFLARFFVEVALATWTLVRCLTTCGGGCVVVVVTEGTPAVRWLAGPSSTIVATTKHATTIAARTAWTCVPPRRGATSSGSLGGIESSLCRFTTCREPSESVSLPCCARPERWTCGPRTFRYQLYPTVQRAHRLERGWDCSAISTTRPWRTAGRVALGAVRSPASISAER